MRSGRFLTLLFLFALLVRGAYAWRIRDLPTQHALVVDARHYDENAQRIVREGWWPRRVFYQAPLYPYFLAVIYEAGGSRAAVRLLQVLAGAATAVLLALAAARLFGGAGDKAPGKAAGLLAALYGPFVFYGPLLLKTALTLFFEALVLLLLVPPRGDRPGPIRLALAGVALGTAALLTENLLLVTPFVLLFLLLADREVPWRRRGAAALAFAAGTTLALAPVTLINYRLGHELVLTSSQGGMNVYIGNQRGASGTFTPLSGGSQDPWQQVLDTQQLAARLAGRATGRPVDPASLKPGEVSSILVRETLREIREAPFAWVRLMGRKIRLFWNAYEIPDAEGYGVYRRLAGAVAWPWLGFGLVAPLGLAGLTLAWRRERRGSLLCALLTAGACASVLPFFILGRYRLPVVPFLIPPAGFALTAFAGLIRRQATRDLAWAGAGLAAFLLVVNLPVFTAAETRGHDAVIWFNLSSAALRWAEEEEAVFRAHRDSQSGIAHLERAVDLTAEAADDLSHALEAHPGFVVARVQRAVALHRRGVYLASGGALEPALASYREARQALAALGPGLEAAQGLPEAEAEARGLQAALNANSARALTNLGGKRLEAGDLRGAETALRQAIALAPGSAPAYGNLGLCLLQKGDRAGSREAFARALHLAGPAAPPAEVAFYQRGLELAGN